MENSQEPSKPIQKKRRILDISSDDQFFNLDIRISLHKSQISQELVSDLLLAKEKLVNGCGNLISYAKISQDENGADKISIGSDQYYGLE